MGLIDWLIVIIPTVLIVGVGIYSRRYIKGVADFLSAGRVAGRYVISIGIPPPTGESRRLSPSVAVPVVADVSDFIV